MNEYPQWFVEFIDYCFLEMYLPDVEKYLVDIDDKLWRRNYSLAHPDSNETASILEVVRWKVCTSIWKEELHIREDMGGTLTRSVNLVEALKSLDTVSTNDPNYWIEQFLKEFIELL